jgi:hypothetical protein
VKTFLMLCLLTFSFALAQDWYAGLGVYYLAPIPMTGTVGYNQDNFGIRVSIDQTFAGPELYGRILLDENQSNIYLGGGLGLRLFAFDYSSFPLTIQALLGGEWRIDESTGLFFELAPGIPLTGLAEGLGGLGDVILALAHIKIGLNYHF